MLARLDTSQECLVRGARRRARDRQTNTTEPSLVLGAYSLNALSATLYEEFGSSSDTSGVPMTPSAALREESGSGSLARGRPNFIHRSLVVVKPTFAKEAFIPSVVQTCGLQS